MSQIQSISFSAVVITLNEATNITACLKSLKQVADEIIVLDAHSKDATAQIAKDLGAKVIQKEWVNYSENKNFANACTKHNWVLSIDADEVLSEELIKTLQGLKPKPEEVYALDRLSNFCGQWVHYGAWYPDWKVRLFNKKKVQWQGNFVHETLQIPSHFKTIRLKGKLWHYSYKTLGNYQQRTEKYAELAAKDLWMRGKKAHWWKRFFSPLFRFCRDYFLKKGLLDGKIGWKIAVRNAWVVHQKYKLLNNYPQKEQ